MDANNQHLLFKIISYLISKIKVDYLDTCACDNFHSTRAEVRHWSRYHIVETLSVLVAKGPTYLYTGLISQVVLIAPVILVPVGEHSQTLYPK